MYFNGQTVALFRTVRHGVEPLGRFRLSVEADFDSLRQTLLTRDRQPTAMIVDLIEEEFREEVLPHAIGRDRKRLHRRHAGKLFRNTPFRYCHVLGRQAEGRRDDQVLFSALTNADAIQPLLDLLEQTATPLSGIHSLPLLTRRLLKPLHATEGHVLVVSLQPDEGLRQTYAGNGQVLFSRVAPVAEQLDDAAFVAIVKAEVHKTHRYLHSLRLLQQDQNLQVHVICSSKAVELLEDRQGLKDTLDYHPVELAALATVLGFRSFPDNAGADSLFVFLRSRKPTPNQYATAPQRRLFHTRQTRLGLRAASWLLAVVGTTLAGMQVIDGLLMSRQETQLQQAIVEISGQQQLAAESLPMETEDVLAMREAVRLADSVYRQSADQAALLRMTGAAFADHPALALDGFEWFVSATADSDAGRMEKPDDYAQDWLEPAHYVITRIRGHVRQQAGTSYLRMDEQIKALADSLKAESGVVEVSIVRTPLNQKTDAALQGDFGVSQGPAPALFELRIVMELQHGSI